MVQKKELDLQSLLGLHVHSCTHWLRPRNTIPPHLGSYTRALLVRQGRRHLFVTSLRWRHTLDWVFLSVWKQDKSLSSSQGRLPFHGSQTFFYTPRRTVYIYVFSTYFYSEGAFHFSKQRTSIFFTSRTYYSSPEAEFLDVIGTKNLRVFLLAIHSHLY
jgi:hypothetical protein